MNRERWGEQPYSNDMDFSKCKQAELTDKYGTPHELAILQGFEDYKFYGGKTSVRKQIGNAVPPPLIKAFGFKLT